MNPLTKMTMRAMVLACAAMAVRCGADSPPVRASLDCIAGDVRVIDRGSELPVRAGMNLPQGCLVVTGDESFARIAMDIGTVAVYGSSRVEIFRLTGPTEKSPEAAGLRIDRGTVVSRVVPGSSRGGGLGLYSSGMSASAGDADFLFGVEKGGGVVACFLGSVSAGPRGGEDIILGPGRMITFGPGHGMKTRPVPPRFRYRDFEPGKGHGGVAIPDAGKGDRSAPAGRWPRPVGSLPKPEVGLPAVK